MKVFKNFFLINKKQKNKKGFKHGVVDQYKEIANLVKEARIQRNLTIKELSNLSKIPEQTINSIESNNKKNRPEYPFIRSILIKLEECLVLKKYISKFINKRKRKFKEKKKRYIVRNLIL